MINHARTLLLNTRPQNNQLQDAGYEYIPSDFRPVTLSPPLAAIYKILFGAKPDMYFLNLRGRELLTYIHQTELAAYAYKLDPRVTYWPPTNAPFFENAKSTVTALQTAGLPRPLNLSGAFFASGAAGTTTKRYEITTTGNNAALSVSLQDKDSVAPPSVTVIEDAGNPPVISFPETKLQFKLDLQAAPIPYAKVVELADVIITERYAPEVDPSAATARWSVVARANPKPAITTVLPILELLGEPLFLDLFGVVPAEPYATFKNLWFDHPLSAYRLAGIVLAFIYRADELRKVSNG
jgi:hypothetical protein